MTVTTQTPTPTAATPTPEELAAQTASSLFDGTIITESQLRETIASAIRQHSEAQRAEIERLTKERDELRARDLSWSKTFQRIEVEANEDVRKLATSLERERVMREALKPFGTGAVAQAVEDSDYSIMRERIVDWFGPSDFKAAREAYGAALQQQETADGC